MAHTCTSLPPSHPRRRSFIEKSKIADPHNVRLWLKVNDEVRQDGNSKDMIFSIPRLIAHVSSIMRIEAGDLLLTGQ